MNYTNVFNAVHQFGIKYPVAMDSNYATWTAYNNHYWPADYLIDKNGNIRYMQFGEGSYNVTESAIQALLKDAGYNFSPGFVNVSSNVNFSRIGTPEIYVGYDTARSPIGNAQGFSANTIVNYSLVNVTTQNVPYFFGQWYNAPDGMISVNNNSRLFLVYYAKNLNIVAGSKNGTEITVKLDGKNITQPYAGSDVKVVNGTGTTLVDGSRLYDLISAPGYGGHVIEIDAHGPGFKLYTFTFG